jgi:hypothetical protein
MRVRALAALVHPDEFYRHFAKGTDDVQIHLNAEMKIDGLLFKPPVLAKL